MKICTIPGESKSSGGKSGSSVDCYSDDSLKGTTQSNRGVGIRQKVTMNGFLP